MKIYEKNDKNFFTPTARLLERIQYVLYEYKVKTQTVNLRAPLTFAVRRGSKTTQGVQKYL